MLYTEGRPCIVLLPYILLNVSQRGKHPTVSTECGSTAIDYVPQAPELLVTEQLGHAILGSYRVLVTEGHAGTYV